MTNFLSLLRDFVVHSLIWMDFFLVSLEVSLRVYLGVWFGVWCLVWGLGAHLKVHLGVHLGFLEVCPRFIKQLQVMRI